jgi:hypothetical protein
MAAALAQIGPQPVAYALAASLECQFDNGKQTHEMALDVSIAPSDNWCKGSR